MCFEFWLTPAPDIVLCGETNTVCVLRCGCLFAPHSAEAKGKPRGSARLQLSRGRGAEQCVERQSLSRAVEARLQRRAFRADQTATLYVQIASTRNDY